MIRHLSETDFVCKSWPEVFYKLLAGWGVSNILLATETFLARDFATSSANATRTFLQVMNGPSKDCGKVTLREYLFILNHPHMNSLSCYCRIFGFQAYHVPDTIP